MAINKVMQAALRALAYPDIDVKRNYKFVRQVVNAAHYHYLKPFYKTWDHEIIVGDHAIPTRIYAPGETGQEPDVLLFFHGGGWVHGSIDSYDKVCSHMAKITGCAVISVDYRLAPEFPYPAALDDCYAVVREILFKGAYINDPSRVTLIGDSAGANLAAAVSLMGRDRGEFVPARQILIYPATAAVHDETSPFPSIRENGTDYLLTAKRLCDYMDLYAPDPEDRRSPYFAPLLAGDLTHQPETLLITAEYDPLRDEGEAYGEALRAAGNYVEVHRMPDALHGFFALPPSYQPVRECYDIINHFLSGERY